MPKTLKIFAYKNSVGAVSDMENGSFINDVKDNNQLGVVVSVHDASITTEALKLMKTNFKKAGGSFSSVMLTRSETDEYPNSICLLGFGKHGIAINESVTYGRECDVSVLNEIEIDDSIDIPEDFILFIDSQTHS